jgi:hypothetical protein
MAVANEVDVRRLRPITLTGQPGRRRDVEEHLEAVGDMVIVELDCRERGERGPRNLQCRVLGILATLAHEGRPPVREFSRAQSRAPARWRIAP